MILNKNDLKLYNHKPKTCLDAKIKGIVASPNLISEPNGFPNCSSVDV